MSQHPPEPPPRARGKTQRLLEAAERHGIVRAARPLHDRGRASLLVLAYHRVIPANLADSYPFDLELISATPTEFAWQMEYLRRNMNPVSLAQIIAHLDGERPLPPRAVAITFDDGFSDIYRHAFPILRRYELPAAVFVTTGNVDSHEPFWFELAAYFMMRLPPGSIEIPECDDPLPAGDSGHERRRSLVRLLAVLKSIPNDRRAELIRSWQARFAAHIDPMVADLSRPVTWQEIAEMAAAGIEFGSHTVTHPNLRQLPDADLSWELAESKRVLEQRLMREIAAVAYPIGTDAAYDDRVVEGVRRCGFRLAVSYISGVNWAHDLARFEVRRLGVELRTTRSYFRALTMLPAWIS